MAQGRGPVAALNRALAMAERDGIAKGGRELRAFADDKKVPRYRFCWAGFSRGFDPDYGRRLSKLESCGAGSETEVVARGRLVAPAELPADPPPPSG